MKRTRRRRRTNIPRKRSNPCNILQRIHTSNRELRLSRKAIDPFYYHDDNPQHSLKNSVKNYMEEFVSIQYEGSHIRFIPHPPPHPHL
jgi:hypothetical protein